MIELKEGDYVLGYWFSSDAKENCWYCIIIKRGDKWEGEMTFRYAHEGDQFDPFDEKDEKKKYSFKHPSKISEEIVITMIDSIWELSKSRLDYYSDMFLVQGDRDKFFEIAKTKDYLHFKQVH